MYDKILFLDFDGTITAEDTLDGCMRRTIDPVVYDVKHNEMLSGKITLSQAIHMAFGMIPSSRFSEMMEYVRGVPIRKGFDDLLAAMKEQGTPVVVVSGGLKPYVEEKLAPYRDRLLDIHSVELDLSDRYMRLVSEYEECGDLLQKTLVMSRYDYKTAICVGDSHSDVRMAKASQLVFARDLLAKLLEKQGVHYIPWSDFYEVRDNI